MHIKLFGTYWSLKYTLFTIKNAYEGRLVHKGWQYYMAGISWWFGGDDKRVLPDYHRRKLVPAISCGVI